MVEKGQALFLKLGRANGFHATSIARNWSFVLTSQANWPISLPIHRKRQQHVARNPAHGAVSGIDVDHALHYDGAGAVERSAARFDAVHRLEVAHGIEIPNH